MGMMDILKKKIKVAAEVTAEVMNSPCCDEDESAGSEMLQTERGNIRK